MKVAIVGSSGYIGQHLLSRLKSCDDIESILKIDRNESADVHLELTNAAMFDYNRLDGIDYVIFTAAISSPDECAINYDHCWNINVTGTKCFIRQALARDCRVLFFSSDAVFGDISGEIYTEESETRPITPYGKMKKAVEDEFKNHPDFKAIRLSYVASARDKFISYCLACIRDGKKADVFHPFYRNVITLSNVIDVVIWFIKNWIVYKPFVFNVAGKELVSRVRIADELNRILDNQLAYSISTPGDEFYNYRPKITHMQSIYINQYNIIDDNTFTEKIQKELEEYKK